MRGAPPLPRATHASTIAGPALCPALGCPPAHQALCPPPPRPSPAVVSSYDSRDVVLQCLSAGASDYWLKPLRANEVRNLWTRVWWRKVGGGPGGPPPAPPPGMLLDNSSDDASLYTKK